MPKRNITVWLSPETIDKLDKLIKNGEIESRGEGIRKALRPYFELKLEKEKGKPF